MNNGWKERLLKAIEEDGRSDRVISMDAGLGQNFVNQLKKTDRSPSIESLEALIDCLNVSKAYIFMGYDISKEDFDLLEILHDIPEDSLEALLKLVRAGQK